MFGSVDAFVVFKCVVTLGLAVWSAIAALNNLVAFGASTGAIGRTLSMSPLREAPAIDISLLRRAVHAKALAVMALIAMIVLQGIAAICLAYGGGQLAIALASAGSDATGIHWGMFGLTALAAAWLLMMIGGLWFGYWIRQEGLQLTHMMLLVLTIATAALLRM
ncbi:DUF2165 family protein [Pandoraea norimbergensis]|uniref:DUF2165 domain-containing protein n=1 Tax=Pandoraea norimbergensis TaxID=93219 RepID=A0ABM5WM28_9BURK|nr:DUF2165 family protein [Pandoraea norimbergensis]ALS61560.1 hypothetical protein AT302_19090 [Pandoraea norimbergensis]